MYSEDFWLRNEPECKAHLSIKNLHETEGLVCVLVGAPKPAVIAM
jgi:hypothetical protein